MCAIVMEIHANDEPDSILFYMGVVGDTWFPIPDDTATPANGWHLVRMSERTWQQYAGRSANKARVNVFSGVPLPLNPDGTFVTK